MESQKIQDGKIMANYRYPGDCCGLCTHAYQNEYGDYQCTMLPPGNIIDLGAICDHYHKELYNDND